MTSKESSLFAQMQNLGFSDGIIMVALNILKASIDAQDDALFYLYDKTPSENDFLEYLADICQRRDLAFCFN